MVDQSHEGWTIERHIAGRPDFAVALYRQFIHAAEEIRPFTYAVSKSAITLKGDRRGFTGVRLDSQGIRGYLDLQREVRDARISNVSPYTTRLFVHHFRLRSPDELDDEFVGWLREAYDVGNGAHLRAPERPIAPPRP